MIKRKLFIAIAVISVLRAGSSFADEEISFDLTVDHFGKYIWRGQNLDDDIVLQPGISANYNGLTVGIWGSMELTKINNCRNEITEFDFSLDYSGVMPGLSGGETFDLIKKIHTDIKVLLSSGYSLDGEAEEILRRGCSGFIQKPYTMNELSEKVTSILRT